MRVCVLLAAGLLASAAGTQAQAQVLINNGGRFDLDVVSFRDIPFRSVVRQQYDFSCGSAALATLLRHHYGRDVDEEEVFKAMFADGDQAEIQRVGFSLLDMKRYLAAHGYEGDGFRMSLEEMGASRSPAIMMVNTNGYRHFVVFKGIDDGRVLIGDPALGLKIYTHEEFKAIWNGVAFIVRDPADRFNEDRDWRPWAEAPVTAALTDTSLASLTRDLPPLYQITSSFSLDFAFR